MLLFEVHFKLQKLKHCTGDILLEEEHDIIKTSRQVKV